MNWNEYLMNVAHAVKLRSKDPKTQVGCVIVDHWNRIVSTGYNGMPPGSSRDTNAIWGSDDKHEYVVHAEQNALDYIRYAVIDRGADYKLYTTHYPCIHCARLICDTRVMTIFYDDLKFFNRATEDLLNDHGIETVYIFQEINND